MIETLKCSYHDLIQIRCKVHAYVIYNILELKYYHLKMSVIIDFQDYDIILVDYLVFIEHDEGVDIED